MTTSLTAVRPPGPPSKLNDSMIAALSIAVAKGNYQSTACNLCGISEVSLWNWLNQAEQDFENGLSPSQSIYLRLFYALKKAEAEAEAKLVDVVRQTAEVDRNWIAGMTFLERRHPDRWGRKDRLQPGGNIYNINIEKALITAGEKFDEAIEKLAARQAMSLPGSDRPEIVEGEFEARDTEG